MDVSCYICKETVDTKKNPPMVTTGWILGELYEKNNVEPPANIPRLVYVCTHCWGEKFPTKLELKTGEADYAWPYSKDI